MAEKRLFTIIIEQIGATSYCFEVKCNGRATILHTFGEWGCYASAESAFQEANKLVKEIGHKDHIFRNRRGQSK